MRQKAFTIVELLVVLAIITAIMGLLLPVLRAARLQAKSVICLSNEKQILASLLIYENKNGVFPHGFDKAMTFSMSITSASTDCPGDPSKDKAGKWWFQYLDHNYGEKTKNSSIFWCPARKITDSSLKPNILCGNYGVNRLICKDVIDPLNLFAGKNEYTGIPLNSSKISHPQNTLLIVDSGYSLISWHAATNTVIKPKSLGIYRENAFYIPGVTTNSRNTLLAGNMDAVDGRHSRGTVNAGYVDGHIANLKADKLFVTEENGVYKNISPTWKPK